MHRCARVSAHVRPAGSRAAVLVASARRAAVSAMVPARLPVGRTTQKCGRQRIKDDCRAKSAVPCHGPDLPPREGLAHNQHWDDARASPCVRPKQPVDAQPRARPRPMPTRGRAWPRSPCSDLAGRGMPRLAATGWQHSPSMPRRALRSSHTSGVAGAAHSALH